MKEGTLGISSVDILGKWQERVSIYADVNLFLNIFVLKYKTIEDSSFPASMLCCLILLAMAVAVQALMLPR